VEACDYRLNDTGSCYLYQSC